MELKIKTVNTMTSSDGSQYGKFTIEPLERGFGTTIGNALRRVLLSSLEGTAVTSCRIEGITHEYTAIPGVLEDVIDLDRYAIYHEDPAPSSNNNLNKTYSSLKVENGYSVSSGINVNGKGHIYGESSNYILPQAIVSATAPANVPIGTLWYDTSTNS